MGDHARQYQTNTNRQQSHGHKYILQGSNQWRLLLTDPAHGYQVASSIKNQNEEHRTRQLHME